MSSHVHFKPTLFWTWYMTIVTLVRPDLFMYSFYMSSQMLGLYEAFSTLITCKPTNRKPFVVVMYQNKDVNKLLFDDIDFGIWLRWYHTICDHILNFKVMLPPCQSQCHTKKKDWWKSVRQRELPGGGGFFPDFCTQVCHLGISNPILR